MARLKHESIFLLSRTYKWWLVTIDGEKIKFVKKGLALMGARAAKSVGKSVRLIEVTKYVQYKDQINPKNCKISIWENDISNQIDET